MDTESMTFYNHIENVRTMAINLTNGEPWHGAIDKARMFDSLDASRREYMQLQEENAKLRELVRDMYRCSDPCNDCPHYNGSNSGFYCGLGIGWKARRMRELGIE